RAMIAGVMRLADRSGRALMTRRRDVEMLRLDDEIDEIRALLRSTRRSRLPVQDGEADAVVGVVLVKDIAAALSADPATDLRLLVNKAPIVTDNSRALDVLKAIRASTVHMALVFDEYGHFEGIITSGDFLEAITGTFEETGSDEPALVRRSDGSWLVSGWMPIDEFTDATGFPASRRGDYKTVAGLVLGLLNRLPEVGETFDDGTFRFEVVDLDGRRIDKVLVSRVAEAQTREA
ncbi:MAG: hemolysin family protein, partial [Alphaproteobacteria bacterium]